MSSYIPLTASEERKILQTIGVQSIEDLFSSIPPKVREKGALDLGSMSAPLSEHELRRYFGGLAARNSEVRTHFLGGGVYDNIVPALVDQLVLRGEFLTCYTPYQPEISQGTLAAIFEFQTLICRLTQMEVANASLYDGATATAEAVLMAQRLGKRSDPPILVAGTLPPEYKQVMGTFLRCHSSPPIEVRWNEKGEIDRDHLAALCREQEPAALVVAYPNYFGIVEDVAALRKALPEGTLLILAIPDPSVLALFEAPGPLGADIVAGEAHQFGTPMLLGGPHVGFFATKRAHLRQMPGRLVGESVDSQGRRAYTLTMATREQHIRREKATSNICTNQGLIALRTTIYLSFLGKRGFEQLGTTNYSRFQYLRNELEAHGIPLKFKTGVHYREGVFEVPNIDRRFDALLERGVVAGIRLRELFPGREDEFQHSLLVCAHPKHTKAELDELVEGLSHG